MRSLVPPPPPDSRLVPVASGLFDDPVGHGICIGIALLALTMAWRSKTHPTRACWSTFGVVIGFTSPWLARINEAWFGRFPTIDKEGSLLFFLDGVHRRLYFDPLAAPTDDAIRLIGVHAGHLWVTEALSMFLSPMAAFNLQWLLSAALAWAAASWAIRVFLEEDQPTSPDLFLAALAAGFPFGMGLHLFRDLDVTTVEKGGIAFVALFMGCWVRAARRGGRWVFAAGLVYGLMALYNLYFAIVCAAFGALHLTVSLPHASRATILRRLQPTLACALPGLLIGSSQLLLQDGGAAVASPERFLWERAALDGVSVWPPAWNRLEAWRACNPIAVMLAAVGLHRWGFGRRTIRGLGIGLFLFLLSLGPVLLPGPELQNPRLTNPVYMAVHAMVPGFWRIAEPEVFFQPVWFLALVAAAAGLRSLLESSRRLGRVALLLIFVVWWPLVRAHPAFPALSAPVQSMLDPAWRQRVFVPASPVP